MSGHCGYQGFRSQATMVPPRLPPGETLESRAHKFQDSGNGLVYSAPLPARSRWDATMTKTALTNVSRRDYRVPDRRGIAATWGGESGYGTVKLFLGKTMYRTTYESPAEALRRLRLYAATKEPFEEAFKRAAHRGVLDVSRLGAMLDDAMDGTAPDWVKGKMKAACYNLRDGRITWDGLRERLGLAMLAAIQDVTPAATSIPEWMVLSAKPVPHIISGPALESCYQHDIGGNDHPPQGRDYTFKSGMMSMSQDLYQGTSKDTFHIPGYDGHIPVSRRNPTALRQSDAEVPRPSRELIGMNVKNAVGGYTGHLPQSIVNARGERLCGVDPLTTTGAASRHWML